MQINDYCLVDRLEVSRKQGDHLQAKAVKAKPEKSRWLLTFHLYAKTKKKKKKGVEAAVTNQEISAQNAGFRLFSNGPM